MHPACVLLEVDGDADAFIRPFRYRRWRNDWYQARDGHQLHRRRILELLPSAFLSGQGRHRVHQKLKRCLRWTLQVRSLSSRIWGASLKDAFVYDVTVLKVVDSRMLRLVLTGTEWSSVVRLVTSGEPAPALQCVIDHLQVNVLSI